jgi:hypothetical protein
VALQRWRGKSPLAIESINDRYCRSPRGYAVARNATSRMTLDVDVFILFNRLRRDGDQRSCTFLDSWANQTGNLEIPGSMLRIAPE